MNKRQEEDSSHSSVKVIDFGSLILISLNNFANCVTAFPLFALGFAIFYSVLFDFERSTGTSCMVPNYLPSISASIALTPQAYVWRIGIAIQALPRIVAAYLYWVWYSRQNYDHQHLFYSTRHLLRKVAAGSNLFEVVSLLGLTLVSSREIKIFHEACFVLFMIGAVVYMCSTCILFSMINTEEQQIKASLKRKKLSLLFSILGAFGATYTYLRHNILCEPFVYTCFACCEYVIAACNGIFHYSITMDLKDYSFNFFFPN